MGVTFSAVAFEKQYLSTQDKLEQTIIKELSKYIKELRSELYRLMLRKNLSKSEYDKIIDKIQAAIGIHTLDVQKHIKDIYIEVLNESRLGNKDYKQSILNYETAKAVNDVTRDFHSAYNDTKQAIDHIRYVMETQSERDKNALWNNIKNLSPEKIKDNIAAYRDVFQTDYGQRIMKEMTENPLLNQLITQEDDKLYITLNGKKYNLDSYVNTRAKYYTTNVAHQISRAEDKEQGWTIFRFVRIEDVNKERPHSIHDNEHNNDVFTTDPNLVGLEFDGKILLDAYKAIEDYPYGEQPPFGCRHVWVGVAKGLEINPDGPNEPVNGAAAKENETEKSMGSEDFIMPAYDQSKLTQEELDLISVAEKATLNAATFNGTGFETNCEVIAYNFTNPLQFGDYSFTENRIRISDSIEDSLKRGMCKIRNGIKYFSEDEIIALDAYAHEWVHSVSNKTVFDVKNQMYKDVMTEYVARALVHEKTKIRGFGGYDLELQWFNTNKMEGVNSFQIMSYLKSEDITNIEDYFKTLLKSNSEIEALFKLNNQGFAK